MTGCLHIEQHFLPLHFGSDSNLLNYESYQDFKEEFQLSNDPRSSRKHSSKILSDLKKLTKHKKRNKVEVVDDDVAETDQRGNQVNVSSKQFKSKLSLQVDAENIYDKKEDKQDESSDHDEEEDVDADEQGPIKGNASLKEVQDLLRNSAISSMNFSHRKKLTLILANGTIVHMILRNIFTHDYVYIVNQLFHFDEAFCSVAYGHRFVLFLFPDNKLVVARKQCPSGTEAKSSINRNTEISTFTDFLPKQSLKRANKQIALNEYSNLFLIWWSNSKDDVFPWNPKPEERANVLVYGIDEYELEPVLLYFIRTEHNLLKPMFIRQSDEIDDILVLETVSNLKTGQTSVKETIIEMLEGGSSTKIITETMIPIQSTVTCFSYNNNHQKLAIGCFDTSIVIHSKKGKITHCKKCTFIPFSVCWHPDSYMLIALGDQGQFQLFDIVLTPILLSNLRNNVASLTQELVPSSPYDFLTWSHIKVNDDNSFLLMRSRSGEISFLRICFGRMKLLNLIRFYVTNSNILEAMHVLRNVQWNSEQCIQALYGIFSHLIKQPYSEEIETQLEGLLVVYFAPKVEPDAKIYNHHFSPVRILGKRFFTWLIRARKFERALQVAVNLRHNGLLRHLKAVATVLGYHELAEQVHKSISSDFSESESSASDSQSETSDSAQDEDGEESYSSSDSNASSGSSYTESSSSDDEGPSPTHSRDAKMRAEDRSNSKGSHQKILPANAAANEDYASTSSIIRQSGGRSSLNSTLFTIKEEQCEGLEQVSVSSCGPTLQDLLNRNIARFGDTSKITVVDFGSV